MAEEIEQEQVDEEAQLAQEALDATPEEEPAEEPEVKEVDPKDAVIGEFRRETRELRRELAEVKAQQVSKDAPPKSPLQLAQEQATQYGTTVEFTPELYQAQRTFEEGQAEAKSEQETYAQQDREYKAGLATIDHKELDLLIARGGHLLTENEKQYVFLSGKNSGKELKRILTEHIGNFQPKEKAKTEKTDKSKKAEEEKAKAEAKAKETPSQEEILEDPILDKEYKKLTFAK